jgi:hypothetical protein
MRQTRLVSGSDEERRFSGQRFGREAFVRASGIKYEEEASMKASLSLAAACAMIFAPTVAVASQPAGTATDQSSAPAATPAPKATPSKAAPDATCDTTAKNKSTSTKGGASASHSESVKNITKDTGTDQPAPKAKKPDTSSQTGDCTTQSQ